MFQVNFIQNINSVGLDLKGIVWPLTDGLFI